MSLSQLADHAATTSAHSTAGLPNRTDDWLITPRRLAIVKDIRSNGRRLNWLEARVVEGIQIALTLKPLAAYRLWRAWSPQETIANFRATAFRLGVERLISPGELTDWETGRERLPVELLDAVCQVYRTRPDLVGYRDYSTP